MFTKEEIAAVTAYGDKSRTQVCLRLSLSEFEKIVEACSINVNDISYTSTLGALGKMGNIEHDKIWTEMHRVEWKKHNTAK